MVVKINPLPRNMRVGIVFVLISLFIVTKQSGTEFEWMKIYFLPVFLLFCLNFGQGLFAKPDELTLIA